MEASWWQDTYDFNIITLSKWVYHKLISSMDPNLSLSVSPLSLSSMNHTNFLTPFPFRSNWGKAMFLSAGEISNEMLG